MREDGRVEREEMEMKENEKRERRGVHDKVLVLGGLCEGRPDTAGSSRL